MPASVAIIPSGQRVRYYFVVDRPYAAIRDCMGWLLETMECPGAFFLRSKNTGPDPVLPENMISMPPAVGLFCRNLWVNAFWG